MQQYVAPQLPMRSERTCVPRQPSGTFQQAHNIRQTELEYSYAPKLPQAKSQLQYLAWMQVVPLQIFLPVFEQILYLLNLSLTLLKLAFEFRFQTDDTNQENNHQISLQALEQQHLLWFQYL